MPFLEKRLDSHNYCDEILHVFRQFFKCTHKLTFSERNIYKARYKTQANKCQENPDCAYMYNPFFFFIWIYRQIPIVMHSHNIKFLKNWAPKLRMMHCAKSFAIADLFVLSLLILYLFSTCFSCIYSIFRTKVRDFCFEWKKKRLCAYSKNIVLWEFHRIFKWTRNATKSKYLPFKRLFRIYYSSRFCCDANFLLLIIFFSAQYFIQHAWNLFAKFTKCHTHTHNANDIECAIEKTTN